MSNNQPNPFSHLRCNLAESLEYKDMEGLVKPEIHVDEFASKMGDDDDIITISFYVRDPQAASDLVNWFERGYDWVIDADRSPGEIKTNRYLVYVELRRRRAAADFVNELLDDMSTLTEFDAGDWSMVYDGKEVPYSKEEFERLVPLSPREYRERKEHDLNEMRVAAGLPVKASKASKDLQSLQAAAGIL